MREMPGSGLQSYTGTTWGTIQAVDDSKAMQRIDVRGLNGELILGIERPQTYGHTSVPLPPEGSKAAEVEIGFHGGDRAHPYVRSTDDRRWRMKNLQPGENASHDDQGQNLHIARDGINHTAKQHVMSATEGSKPLTTFELQDQLKGLGAHVEQLAHTVHGLFDVTSRLNTIATGTIPALSQLAPILNQDPSGLPIMAAAIQGKAVAYLQQHVSEALAKFTSPTIGSISSVLSGGIEGLISAATAEIASVMAANPIVATVDGLVDELATLTASATPAVVAQMAPVIQGLIDSTTAANPIIGQVANLRSTLASLLTSAGPGIGFLAPQQRMVQGLTKSLKLSQ